MKAIAIFTTDETQHKVDILGMDESQIPFEEYDKGEFWFDKNELESMNIGSHETITLRFKSGMTWAVVYEETVFNELKEYFDYR